MDISSVKREPYWPYENASVDPEGQSKTSRSNKIPSSILKFSVGVCVHILKKV